MFKWLDNLEKSQKIVLYLAYVISGLLFSIIVFDDGLFSYGNNELEGIIVFTILLAIFIMALLRKKGDSS